MCSGLPWTSLLTSQSKLDTLIRELKGKSSFRPTELFPDVEIDAASFACAPELLAPVRVAMDEIRTQHRTLLPLMQRRFYYHVRAKGFTAADEALRHAAQQTETPQAYIVCLITLGEFLYRQLPAGLIQPTRCLDVIHRFGNEDRKLAVRCRSLQVTETPNGPAYYSRRKPRLCFGTDERERLVAFSKHALERICERTAYNWRNYGAHGDAFAFLDNCVYFEDCTADRQEPSFVIYNSCVPHHASWDYVDQILPMTDRLRAEESQLVGSLDYIDQVLRSLEPGRKYYYRVGYCPVSFHGDVAKAITLLVPGMKGTPERSLIEQSGFPAAEIARLKAQVESQLSMKDLVDGGDYTLVKWFHENGVPQVVHIEGDVFRYDCDSPDGVCEISDGGRVHLENYDRS